MLLIVGLWVGVIFVVVGLFPWLCGFDLVAPAKQHRGHGWWNDPQSTSWREGRTKESSNNNQNPITPKELAERSSQEHQVQEI